MKVSFHGRYILGVLKDLLEAKNNLMSERLARLISTESLWVFGQTAHF
jgi:hypothetical protein